MRNFYKGMVYGLPISLAMWAAMAAPVTYVAVRHPHVLAHLEEKVRAAIGSQA